VLSQRPRSLRRVFRHSKKCRHSQGLAANGRVSGKGNPTFSTEGGPFRDQSLGREFSISEIRQAAGPETGCVLVETGSKCGNAHQICRFESVCWAMRRRESDVRCREKSGRRRSRGPATEVFVDLSALGLASMYPASRWSGCAPGHNGYQRACVLIGGQASTGPFGSPGFACAGKTGSPSRLILSQTSAGNCGATSWLAPYRCSSLVRAMRPFLRPVLRFMSGAARRDRQSWPSHLARLWLGVSRPCLDGTEHGAMLKQIEAPSHLIWCIRSCAPC
jgi:hypothetical protein